jgi:prepilin-type N-terminal cleavage/methylation domain-containing protein/prepilin-type processing-associated H-X9-DG protein
MKGRRMNLRCLGLELGPEVNRKFLGPPTPSRLKPGLRTLGFSLIELLVTVALILILFTLYWHATAGRRERDRLAAGQAGCQRNLEKLFVSLEIYANDHAGRFPNATNARTAEEALDSLVPRYTADTSLFVCPCSRDAPLPSGESLLKHKISYAYYTGRGTADAQQVLMSDRQVDARAKAAGQPVFSASGQPPGNNHGSAGGTFLFGDGHAENIPANAPFSIALPPGVVLLNPKP